MASFRKTFVLLCGLAIVAGCSFPKTVTPLVADNDPVSLRMAQAAEKAAKALDNIAAVEQARTPAPPPEDFADAPEVLLRATTVNWTGPVDVIAQAMAERAGYGFKTMGAVPPVPITVTIDAYEQPLVRVLRDIGLQLGQRATLSVDALHGMIEIDYASVDKANVQ